MSTNKLLTPDNHALLLIDHQYLQLLTLRSHDASQVISNVQAVAKASKIFKVPTLLTTAFAQRQDLIKEVQDVYPSRSRSTQPPSIPRKIPGCSSGSGTPVKGN